MSESSTKYLSYLFEKPQEPIFLLKGDETKVSFKVPQDLLSDKYQALPAQIVTRLGDDADERVNVGEISIPPLDDILELKRHDTFSLFIPKHRELAGKLIEIFLGVRNVDDFIAVAISARERVNPYLFVYSLSVAMLHRPDTKDKKFPSIVYNFPDKFLESKVIGRARETAGIFSQEEKMPLEIPKDYTASDLEDEHKVAYFREDIGVNLHHWHWHLVYPTSPKSVATKDRRGELFYYMHQQIIARYNFERLCNQLKRVQRLLDWDAPIEEAYFPKLDRIITGRSYPARVANQTMQNLRRPKNDSFIDISDLKRWRDNILDAINTGFAKDVNNKDVVLGEFDGIDILGNIVESSSLSINPKLYGSLHNQGHNIIGYIHDPDSRHLEDNGVMGDVATAMRDPVFYRWHNFIDDLFQKFKATLPQYTEDQLNFPGVKVSNIEVKTSGRDPNTLLTYWQQSDVNISGGLDFQSFKGKVQVRFTHLQHANFQYTIEVENKSKVNKEGTCRIFLAPKHDERGLEWNFNEQRLMFIEMDKFKVNLKQGKNIITRMSTQSSVTIPFERSYRDLTEKPTDTAGKAQFEFCGCGWPHNLLTPRGTAGGFPCQLFVMISNYANDKVDQDTDGPCNDAYSYCGLKGKLYPDRRSMGYPFDRAPRNQITDIQRFLTPNMRLTDVKIAFEDRIFKNPQN